MRATTSTARTRSPSSAPRSPTARPSRSATGCASRPWPPRVTPSRTSPTPCTTPPRTRTLGGVFTGGSLLYGSTGRPDLMGEEHTDTLVRHQHASAHKLADLLPDETDVFPTHGFGSFCSASQSDATASTIGREKESNPALTQDEETYVKELLEGLSRLPDLLRTHGPGQPGGSFGARPERALARRRSRAASPHRGRRVGRRPAQPHRLRGGARTRDPELRSRRRVRHLPRLADHLGHPGDPARRERRRRGRGPARAGPDRHRPSGRTRDRWAAGLGRG